LLAVARVLLVEVLHTTQRQLEQTQTLPDVAGVPERSGR